MEVTLKEAASLCKKSEKTLRRKIDAGLLEGRKEPLEFGGFMWMIDTESLDELYPGSKPSQLPALFDAPEPPQVRLKSRPEEDQKNSTGMIPHDEIFSEDNDLEPEDGEEWNVRQSFLDYILEENRHLKFDLKERDARILSLNERAFVLERALGEQEGASTTQSRVLEWFQTQEAAREKSRNEKDKEALLLAAGPKKREELKSSPYFAAMIGATVTLSLFIVFLATGLINFAAT